MSLFSFTLMKAFSASNTSISFYQSARCNIPEDSNLYTRRLENLKSYLDKIKRELKQQLLAYLALRSRSFATVRPKSCKI